MYRAPDLFLSHSSRDKPSVHRLAEDLCFCEVDAWFDAWEIEAGDSIHDVISDAMGRARFIGIYLGPNYMDSRWARDELKKALAHERNSNRKFVIPLLCGDISVPSFLEDKVYIDFRDHYYHGVLRLAGMIHNVSRQRIEDTINGMHPTSISECVRSLRYCGVEPYVIVGKDYIEEIVRAGGTPCGAGRIRFDPYEIMRSGRVSPMVADFMKRLIKEVWHDNSLDTAALDSAGKLGRSVAKAEAALGEGELGAEGDECAGDRAAHPGGKSRAPDHMGANRRGEHRTRAA